MHTPSSNHVSKIPDGPFKGRAFYKTHSDGHLIGTRIASKDFGNEVNRRHDLKILMGTYRDRYYCVFTKHNIQAALWRPIYDHSHLGTSIDDINVNHLIGNGVEIMERVTQERKSFVITDERDCLVATLMPFSPTAMDALRRATGGVRINADFIQTILR